MKRILAVAIVLTLLISTYSVFSNANALPGQPSISVQPSPINVVGPGSSFSVDVVVSDITASQKVIGIQFKLAYNNTLLQAVDVKEGPFMLDPGWNLHGTTFINFTEVTRNLGPVVTVGDLINPNDNGVWTAFPTGTGTLATITFQVIGGPADLAHSPIKTALTLKETEIVDFNLNDVTHSDISAPVQIWKTTLSVQPSPTNVVVGQTFSVDVVVNNLTAAMRVFGIQFKLAYDTLCSKWLT